MNAVAGPTQTWPGCACWSVLRKVLNFPVSQCGKGSRPDIIAVVLLPEASVSNLLLKQTMNRNQGAGHKGMGRSERTKAEEWEEHGGRGDNS